MSFVGRKEELSKLVQLAGMKKSSLVVITGRRRIGKSTLIHHFANSHLPLYEFQGLAPREGMSNQAQLGNFAIRLAEIFGGAEPKLPHWQAAFAQLAKEIGDKPAVVLLDELSWMAKYDPDFPGHLKIAWDTLFSRKPHLLLVLCGSVASWVEKNILKRTDFVGRVSLVLRLNELPLRDAYQFWGERSQHLGARERLSFISVAGGVPKYLEEFDTRQSTNENIRRLCFTKGGYLYEDFDKIFTDIFEKRSALYKNILRTVVREHLAPKDIARKLKMSQSGDLTEYLEDLELSGFVARDYLFKPGGTRGKLSRLRISDNYLRFYLRYIEPIRDKIEKNLFTFSGLENCVAWDSISGLQFENLVVNRIPEFINLLGLANERILSAGPYFQQKNTRHQACQVDLLVECKPNNFYICEIKFEQLVTRKVIEQVQKKISHLALPRYSTRRPVLIHCGEIDPAIEEAEYFDKILNLAKAYECN